MVRGGRGSYLCFQVAEESSLFCCCFVSLTCFASLWIVLVVYEPVAGFAGGVVLTGFTGLVVNVCCGGSISIVPEKVSIFWQVDSGSFFFDVEQVLVSVVL